MDTAESQTKYFATCLLLNKINGRATDAHRALILRQLQNDNEWCDVTLLGKNSTVGIKGHKLVLALASPYLRAAFKSKDFVESGAHELRLEQIDHETLQVIVNFIYTGALQLSGKEEAGERPGMFDVIIAADDLLMPELVDLFGRCIVNLNKGTTSFERFGVDAVIGFWLFARKHHCEVLENEAFRMIATKADKIAVQPKYVSLRIDDVVFLLRSLSATTPPADADHVCEAAVAWLEFNYLYAAIYSDEVMRQVPLNAMSAGALQRLNGKSFLSAQMSSVISQALVTSKEVDQYN